VKDVDDGSPASKAGIKEGDVITQVNGKEIAGVDEIRNEIKDIKEGDAVKFTFKRGNKTQTAELKIPKRLRTANL
ncbi:MAG: PDZ domain-containing protein, partial [Segetibacter sp.]|nr:PDZ domain-containing protein [Segetibacter sp.]